MNSLNPFNAPGSLQAEQQRIRRERFKFVVWTIVVSNVLLLMGLLIQGCRREPAAGEAQGENGTEMATSNTNATTVTQAEPDTNSSVPPAFEAPPTNATAEATIANPMPTPVQGTGKQYVVVKGDSFYKIAKANGISMKALADANPGVESAKLKVGQALQLPAGAEPSAVAPASAPAHTAAAASPSSARYVVKTGDTLDRIARTHHTTVKAIKALNGLTSDRIVVGHSLKMPQPMAVKAGVARA